MPRVALVGVGKGVQVLLRGLDPGVAHAFHDGFEVGSACQQPRGVVLAQVLHPDREVDPAGFDRGEPDPGAEGVPGDRSSRLGGEQQLVVPDAVDTDVLGDRVEPGLANAEGAGLVVLGVRLREVALAGGGMFLETSTMVSSTARVRRRKSMWRGLRATSSPHGKPASIRVSTISRCWAGSAARRRSYSPGVRVRALAVITLGSSVWSHGL